MQRSANVAAGGCLGAENGASDGSRTRDLQIHNLAL